MSYAPISTVPELLAAAAAAGLVLDPSTARGDTMGLDFFVVHAADAAGTPWIVRTPRRFDVVEAARRETRTLELVGRRLPVAVPSWRVHTDTVIAYPRIEGTPAVTLDTGAPVWNHIDPAAPHASFLDSFADAIAALLAIPEADARAARLASVSIEDSRAEVARAIAETREALAPSDALHARWQRWLAGDSWPSHLAVSHGDLHPGHMLLDASGRLTGILDWTEAKLTDPTLDLAMFHGCFGAGPLAALLERLAARGCTLPPKVAHHAAERWAVSPALGAAWALRTNNPGVLEHCRAQLQPA
jgi:aminoglycoside phosphotransferase (APT) family kinase protein